MSRFRKGEYYPHPPRGPARHKYRMSDAARRQRCRNLRRTRLRSNSESLIIKLLIWQSFFDPEPQPSQRTLARQLGVRRSYIFKVQRKAQTEGMDTLLRHGQRVTLDDVAKAREFTAKLRQQGIIAPVRYRLNGSGEQRRVMTADESIAEQRRFAEEWKRRNPPRYGGGRRIAFSVPIPRGAWSRSLRMAVDGFGCLAQTPCSASIAGWNVGGSRARAWKGTESL